jgi:hypothetical protein
VTIPIEETAVAVLSLNRLPVVDAAGDVFAYVLEVEGGSDQDVAELLAGVVARYSIDGITTGRAVLLPGRLPVLALEELDGATAPEVAFTVSEQQLSDLPTAEALHAQRARRRKVFVSDLRTPNQLVPLKGRADGILLDATAHGPEDVRSICSAAAGSGLAVLMTDVADADQHRAYVAAGVSGSSGPHTVLADELRPRGLCTDRVNTQRLVALLADSQHEITQVEAIVHDDAGLAWRLLQLVDDEPGGQRLRVTSLRQALVAVGSGQLREWISLQAEVGVDNGIDSNADRELAAAVLIRARFCQEITGLVPEADADEGFLAGMLSGVVDILGVDLEEVLAHVHVGMNIERALRDGEGSLAVPMSMIRSPSVAVGTARQAGLDPRAVTYAYLDAVSVAGRMLRRHPDVQDDLQRQSEIGRRLSLARWNEPATD